MKRRLLPERPGAIRGEGSRPFCQLGEGGDRELGGGVGDVRVQIDEALALGFQAGIVELPGERDEAVDKAGAALP
jgi:hypothetical protein